MMSERNQWSTSHRSGHWPTEQARAALAQNASTARSSLHRGSSVPLIPTNCIQSISVDAARLLAAFGIGGIAKRKVTLMDLPQNLTINTGDVVLLTGPSGSGKSQSLPLMLSRMAGDQSVCLRPSFDKDLPAIEVLRPNPKGISLLAAVGLADASAFSRSYNTMSVGQQARLELAAALATDDDVVVVDEWLNALDRPTAWAVAWSTQRALRRFGKTGIFITANDDIEHYLCPDLHIRVRWHEEPDIIRCSEIGPYCSMLDDVVVDRGTTQDWTALKPLHYAAGNPATVHSIWRATHPKIDGPAGVVVASYPDLHSAARNLATDSRYKNVQDRRTASVLNREVVKISRIVVAPQVRGIGVAHKMLNEVVPRLGARYVECVTSMSRWSGFLAAVGFCEVPQTCHDTEAALMDWTSRVKPPAGAYLDGRGLLDWIDRLSVRGRREARRLIWLHYHHFVLHRRTKGPRPKNVPNPDDERWPDAADLAARRLVERPSYWIVGPMDPMTGLADEPIDPRQMSFADAVKVPLEP